MISVPIASKPALHGIMVSHHQETQRLTPHGVSTPAKPAKTVSYGTESTGKVSHLFTQLTPNVVYHLVPNAENLKDMKSKIVFSIFSLYTRKFLFLNP